MAKLILMPDGLVQITGEAPPTELLDQIKHRIGPGEAAVVVSTEEMLAFLELLATQKPEEPAS